jgi:hypothetical protein
MNRRTFLQAGISATMGASLVGDAQAGLAQAPGERPADPLSHLNSSPLLLHAS